MTAGIESKGTIVMNVERCKGCELCIEACPPNVLTMTVHEVNRNGFRFPELTPGCTACRACAQVCPDFVFQVWKFDEPVLTPVDPAEAP